MENQIKLINKIVFEAVRDGADGGGAYHGNEENLRQAMEDWISANNLIDYDVVEVKISDDGFGWDVLQIVEGI